MFPHPTASHNKCTQVTITLPLLETGLIQTDFTNTFLICTMGTLSLSPLLQYMKVLVGQELVQSLVLANQMTFLNADPNV